ncbi:MAG: cytochrome c biogenesis protein CcsA [Shewanellaceae bacterium]|nr:cytochrome c biogenesis protein CcsA [Shewanellaceae bacterium]
MNTIVILSVLSYLCATMLIINSLKRPHTKPLVVLTTTICIALSLHAASLYYAFTLPNGLNFSISNVVSLIHWVIAAVVSLCMFPLNLQLIIPAVYGCAGMALLAMHSSTEIYLKPITDSMETIAHIGLSIAAYSILIISALYSLQLMWTRRQIKHKTITLNSSLTPLITAEKHIVSLVFIGSSLLSLSLATGLVFVDNLFGSGIAHKTLLSLLAWGVYMTMLWHYFYYGCSATAAINYTLSGVTLLTLAYFGARVVKELILTT